VGEQGRACQGGLTFLKRCRGSRVPYNRGSAFYISAQEVVYWCLNFGGPGYKMAIEVHHPQELQKVLHGTRLLEGADGVDLVLQRAGSSAGHQVAKEIGRASCRERVFQPV
jgi:hypothetical protein